MWSDPLLHPSHSELQLLRQGHALPRQPLPFDAHINFQTACVRQPEQWKLTILPSNFFIDISVPRSYVVDDADNTTTVARLLDHVHAFLAHMCKSSVTRASLQLGLLADANVACSISQVLRTDSTLGDADIYNKRGRVAVLVAGPIISAVATTGTASAGGLAHARFMQQQGANASPDSTRQHITMLNNIIGDRTNPPEQSANLPLSAREYTKLEKHLSMITRVPERVCFNCAYMMYPSSDNSQLLKVEAASLPHGKHSCRAYRVAKHFIHERAGQVSPDSNMADASDECDNNVFLCKRVDNDASWQVLPTDRTSSCMPTVPTCPDCVPLAGVLLHHMQERCMPLGSHI